MCDNVRQTWTSLLYDHMHNLLTDANATTQMKMFMYEILIHAVIDTHTHTHISQAQARCVEGINKMHN